MDKGTEHELEATEYMSREIFCTFFLLHIPYRREPYMFRRDLFIPDSCRVSADWNSCLVQGSDVHGNETVTMYT